MNVINLTPHEVRIIRDGIGDIVYPPSGDVARLAMVDLGTQQYPGVHAPVELVEFGHLEKRPPPPDGVTWYIVSLATALGAPREDFLVPYDEVRDGDGRIIGCRMLARSV